jgi:hypothetical protein
VLFIKHTAEILKKQRIPTNVSAYAAAVAGHLGGVLLEPNPTSPVACTEVTILVRSLLDTDTLQVTGI